MSERQLDIFDAISQRDQGLTQVIESSDAGYRDKLLAAIEVLAASGESFTADDVRQGAGDPPAGTHPNIAGAIFQQAVKAGLIRTVGFAHSVRAVGHHNVVRLWRGIAV
jgi:hypothetical protein